MDALFECLTPKSDEPEDRTRSVQPFREAILYDLYDEEIEDPHIYGRHETFRTARRFLASASDQQRAELFAVIALAKWFESVAFDTRGLEPSSLARYPIETAAADEDDMTQRYVVPPAGIERLAAHPWVKGHFQSYFRFEEHWGSVPFRVLQSVFSEAELLRIWNSGFFASHLDDYIKRHEFILWKVQNALWHYSYRRSWNNLALIMKGLSKLSVDKPGFELRVSHSTAWNPLGRSYHHSDVFLDGALAFHLFYRGALVLTVAFNPFANGEVGVVQIQLRQKKGNRFLYQLGAHYVDFALDILARAFGEDKLHIVDGKSAVAGVRASYGQSPCAIDEEAEARIAGIYDRPLERFTREEGFSRENLQKRSYFRLIPRTS